MGSLEGCFLCSCVTVFFLSFFVFTGVAKFGQYSYNNKLCCLCGFFLDSGARFFTTERVTELRGTVSLFCVFLGVYIHISGIFAFRICMCVVYFFK